MDRRADHLGFRPVTGRPFVQGEQARRERHTAAEVDRALTLIRVLAPWSGDRWIATARRQRVDARRASWGRPPRRTPAIPAPRLSGEVVIPHARRPRR